MMRTFLQTWREDNTSDKDARRRVLWKQNGLSADAGDLALKVVPGRPVHMGMIPSVIVRMLVKGWKSIRL